MKHNQTVKELMNKENIPAPMYKHENFNFKLNIFFKNK